VRARRGSWRRDIDGCTKAPAVAWITPLSKNGSRGTVRLKAMPDHPEMYSSPLSKPVFTTPRAFGMMSGMGIGGRLRMVFAVGRVEVSVGGSGFDPAQAGLASKLSGERIVSGIRL
jgi:hypothetical protein